MRSSRAVVPARYDRQDRWSHEESTPLEQFNLARTVLREGGPRALAHRVSYALNKRLHRGAGSALQVDPSSLYEARRHGGELPFQPSASPQASSVRIEWVVPPI